MTGRRRKAARRERGAKASAVAAPPVVRCVAGSEAARCCVGDPWADVTEMSLYVFGEPLPAAVIRAAAEQGVEPHALDQHVEGVHGVEPHNDGYAEAVISAARCVKAGGCDHQWTPPVGAGPTEPA